eukprot:363655-Chlamydomonas_euryale.AAC.8
MDPQPGAVQCYSCRKRAQCFASALLLSDYGRKRSMDMGSLALEAEACNVPAVVRSTSWLWRPPCRAPLAAAALLPTNTPIFSAFFRLLLQR